MKKSKRIGITALAIAMLGTSISTSVDAAVTEYITREKNRLYTYNAIKLQEEILNTVLGEDSKMYSKYLSEKLAYVKDSKVGYVDFEDLQGKILETILDGDDVIVDNLSETCESVVLADKIREVEQDGNIKDEEIKDEEIKDEEVKDEEIKDEEIKDEEVKDEEVKDEEVKDEEIKDEEIKDEEVKDEEVKDEEIKDEEIKDEEIKDEEIKDEEVKDEEIKDEEIKDEEIKDEEIKDEEVKDEEIKDEEVKDEEVKDEEIKDEEVKDEEVKDEEVKDEEVKDEEIKDEEVKDEEIKDEEIKDEEVKDEEVKDEEIKDEEEYIYQKEVVAKRNIDSQDDLTAIFKEELVNYPNKIFMKIKTEIMNDVMANMEASYNEYFNENRTQYPNLQYKISGSRYYPTDEYVDFTFEITYMTYDTKEEIPAETLINYRKESKKVANDFYNREIAGKNLRDEEKVLKINNFLSENAEYNYEGLKRYILEDHVAYGVLCLGRGVCESYAKAFDVLAKKSGIETIYVTGLGFNGSGRGEAHAWNMVKIDGEWYSIDTTWNDQPSGVRHDYFLKNDSFMNKTHRRDTEYNYPVGNGSKDFAEILNLKK